MAIPVDEVAEVTHARCTSCMNCVDICPMHAERTMTWGPPRWVGKRWSNAALITLMLACTTAAVAANHLFPMPSFVKTRGSAPSVTAAIELDIIGLNCRGNATLLMYYLEREDFLELTGYIHLEAWPGPGAAAARITYNASTCDEAAIKEAITEPYYDMVAGVWRMSPFRIVDFDPIDAR